MSDNPLKKIDVAGLEISPITKQDLLQEVTQRISEKHQTFVITPYSEFLYTSMHEPEFRPIFNSADFAIADGIGILWADLFLNIPFKSNRYYINILEAWWHVVWTGASILLNPKLLYKNIPEKIVGADLIWDLAAVAEKNNFSVYLLGAKDNEAVVTAEELKAKFPNLNIVGTSNKSMGDESVFTDLENAKPDMLLIAWPAQLAEKWINHNLAKLHTCFVIALGGTFDYIAGTKKQPPQFVRRIGLEWLYRLITQPTRIRRIYNATWGIVIALVRHKVYANRPYRSNAVAVVVNQGGKILLCKRRVGPAKNGANPNIIWDNYWQFPQGGVDEGEIPTDAAQRELFEETGIKSVELIAQASYINKYTWNNSTRKLFRFNLFKAKGQQQITSFLKFSGELSEIQLDHRELIEYKWLTPAEVMGQIAIERREHAEIVLAELAKIQV